MKKQMEKRNDESNKKMTVLANKLRSIFSRACGRATTARSRAMNMASGKEHGGKGGSGSERPISTPINKTHPCNEVEAHAANTNAGKRLQLACRRRAIVVVALRSRLRRWRSSLKKVGRVKLRVKKVGNEGKPGNEGKAEAKTEVELRKKRILMGEKCRALNGSGVLHYDKQGVLLLLFLLLLRLILSCLLLLSRTSTDVVPSAVEVTITILMISTSASAPLSPAVHVSSFVVSAFSTPIMAINFFIS